MVELNPKDDHLGFRVAYNGTDFSGFQTQKIHDSVQNELEKAFKTVLRFEQRIHFTSRTDTGVHALDQWVILPHAYPLWEKLPLVVKRRLRIALNALLRDHTSVWEALRLNARFKTKAHVEWKEYEYLVMEGRSPVPCWVQSHWAIRSQLDLSAIKKNLKLLEGRHDFKAFTNRQSSAKKNKSTVRNLISARISVINHPFKKEHRVFLFRLRANGFLYHMVRNIIGVMVEIGLRKRDSVLPLLKLEEKNFSGIKAPPFGLTLTKTYVKKKWYKVLNDF